MFRRRWCKRGHCAGSLRVGGLIAICVNLSVVNAQYTDSKCVSNANNAWIFNEAGESPCVVWSKLQYLCLQSVVNVPALKDNTWSYNAPAAELATQCSCNDVAFNLMSACAWCQVGDQSVDPEMWKSSCGDKYKADGLGFTEAQVAVPAFASAAVTGFWNAAAASTSAQSFKAYPTTSYSSTISRAFPTDVKAATSPKAPASSGSSSGSVTASGAAASTSAGGSEDEPKEGKKPIGAIIGGVVGGLVALVAIVIIVMKVMRRGDSRSSVRGNMSSPQPQSAGGRNFHKSFIGGFGQDRMSYSSDDTERGGKAQRMRNTELLNLPESFAEPRPAPAAPTKKLSRFMSGLSRSSEPARVRSGYIKTSDKGAGTFDVPAGMQGRQNDLSHLPPPPGMRDNHMSYGFTPSPTQPAGPVRDRDTMSGDRMTAWTEDEDYYSDYDSIVSGQPGKGPRTTRTLPSLYDPGTAGGRQPARTTMATNSVYSKYVTNPDFDDDVPPVPRR